MGWGGQRGGWERPQQVPTALPGSWWKDGGGSLCHLHLLPPPQPRGWLYSLLRPGMGRGQACYTAVGHRHHPCH